MRLSDAQRWRVLTEDGESLGRVFELRCRGGPVKGRPQDAAEIVTLVYGVVGLLERLGIRGARSCEVRWADIVALRGDALVVRNGARMRNR